jgi:hypothetical protein
MTSLPYIAYKGILTIDMPGHWAVNYTFGCEYVLLTGDQLHKTVARAGLPRSLKELCAFA